MIKKFIYIGLVLGLIGAGVAYYMFNKPVEQIESMAVDFTLTPNELLSAFENDESAANAKYLDKVIVVSGNVTKVETDNDKTSVYLSTDNDLSSIIFQLQGTDSTIKEGEKVTMKGVCTGYLMDVVLVRAAKI